MLRWLKVTSAALFRRKGRDGKPLLSGERSPGEFCRLLFSLLTYNIGPANEVKEAVKLLLRSNGLDGKLIDLDALNCGRKGIRDLFDEIIRSEAMLRLGENGSIIRFAISMKIHIEVGEYCLMETKRVYPNGDTIERLRDYSLSETLQRGEKPSTTAIRGVMEELGFSIDEDQLNLRFGQIKGEMDVHPSSAYLGLESHVLTYRADIILPTRPQEIENGKIIEDNGVLIHTKWFKLPSPKPEKKVLVPYFIRDILETFPLDTAPPQGGVSFFTIFF